MIFKNEKGESLEISILGWENPEEDWLMIKVKGIDDEGGDWEGKDPSLTYDEALYLSEWLVSPGSFNQSTLQFLEPELELEFKKGDLNIYLEWNMRPPWKPSDINSDESYALCFEIKIEELKQQSCSWKEELDRVARDRYTI